MKKKLLVFVIAFFLIIILLTQFGVDIGGVRIGKQIDLKTPQDKNFEKSNFYKEYYSNNNLTVLNLWATWCVPCVEEMSDLNSIKTKYKNDSFNFISLSVDNDSIKLIKFLSKGKFKFKDITMSNLKYRNAIFNTLEGDKTDKWISSQSVPKTYLIKNNKVVAKINGTIESQELIDLIEKNK